MRKKLTTKSKRENENKDNKNKKTEKKRNDEHHPYAYSVYSYLQISFLSNVETYSAEVLISRRSDYGIFPCKLSRKSAKPII
mmetsp:Transcript_2849/g.3056  ORF Transcript_2849/g.3056 Transcript_2849/m.3056 type:complete len:82 (-) Transcript_2849:1246-1491(-)